MCPTRCGVGSSGCVDIGQVLGITTGDAAEIKELWAEVGELCRVNEILVAVSSFSGGCWTRDCGGDRVH